MGQPGAFASLREEFVDDVLGSDPARRTASSPARETTEVASDVVPPRPPTPKLEAGRPPRTIVEHEFHNDHFETAYPVDSIPFTASTETSSATRQEAEPEACEPVPLGGGTVWYRYTPRADLGLIANTFGTESPVTLAVYTGDGVGTLTRLDCDFNEAGNAQVVFPGKNGTTYHFQVTFPGGTHLEFSLDPLGETELASVSLDGQGSDNRGAGFASISANGRYVAFHAAGDNLVPDDNNMCWWSDPVPVGSEEMACQEIFVRDMKTGQTERVAVSSEEEPASSSAGESLFPAISGDGRFVAFSSGAPNLVPDDRNGAVDIFVRDLKKGRTERVSVSSDGNEGHLSEAWLAVCGVHDHDQVGQVRGTGDGCWFDGRHFDAGVSISSDGRFVVFSSNLQGLVPGVPQCTDIGSLDLWNLGIGHPYLLPLIVPGVDAGWLGCRQIYVHDRKTDRTTLASVSSSGEPANGDSSSPFIARGGRWVAFASDASNLAPAVTKDGTTRPDANDRRDAFVHDLRTGTTELVSLSTEEEQGLGDSGGHGQRGHVTISDNGRWVTFISSAPNLAPNDLNSEFDVFLRDLRTGRTELISPGPGAAGHSSISADGRYIALTYPQDAGTIESDAPTAPPQDLLVYDRITKTVTRISVDSAGHKANGETAAEPEISADGHVVAFLSDATNLDERDTDAYWDIYVHELPWTR